MKIHHFLQAAPVYSFYYLSHVLPIAWMSGVFGWLGRFVGARLGIAARAHKNLRLVFPELSAQDRHDIVKDVFDNLCRVGAELPYASALPVTETPMEGPHILVENAAVFRRCAEQQKPIIFISGHMGNWEILAHVATHFHMSFHRVYRKANNPLIDRLMYQGRDTQGTTLIPKGPEGVRPILNALKKGQNVGFLLDQRMSDGERVHFFGHPTTMASAPIEMAMRFDAHVVMARCIRQDGPSFRVEILEPLDMPKEGSRQQKRQEVLNQINAIFEGWIREYPGQWLWLHRRWK